jgi:hypothetical protein
VVPPDGERRAQMLQAARGTLRGDFPYAGVFPRKRFAVPNTTTMATLNAEPVALSSSGADLSIFVAGETKVPSSASSSRGERVVTNDQFKSQTHSTSPPDEKEHRYETVIENVPHTAIRELNNEPKEATTTGYGVTRYGDSAVIFAVSVDKDSVAALRNTLRMMMETHYDNQIKRLLMMQTDEQRKKDTKVDVDTLLDERAKSELHAQLVAALQKAMDETGGVHDVSLAVNIRTPAVAEKIDVGDIPGDLTDVPIELYISSRGGSLAPMLGLVDDMVEMQNTPRMLPTGILPHLTGLGRYLWPRQIRTQPVGYAFSAGFLLMLAGNQRHMGVHSVLMMHEIGYYSAGNQSDHNSRSNNVALSNNSVMDIVGRRSGLLQYAYYGSVNGKVACIFVEPAPAKGGYATTAYVLPTLRDRGTGEAVVMELKEGHGRGRVVIELQERVMITHDGVLKDTPGHVLSALNASQGLPENPVWFVPTAFAIPVQKSNPNEIPTQLARVNANRYKEWVRVLQKEESSTSAAWKPHVAASLHGETVQTVMARFAQQDDTTTASDAHAMGFLNDGKRPDEPSDTRSATAALVPRPGENF